MNPTAAKTVRALTHDRLLDAAIDHFGRHGIGDTSLRGIARELGTSHRMLIYHFGSRGGLLAEVTRAVEARQRAVMNATYDSGLTPLAAAARYWEETVEATLRYGPLFFELAAHAMQGKKHAAGLRDELIAAWLPSVTELCRAIGVPEEQAETHARLALGAARGLLFDLLVSGERENVARAADLLNRLLLLSAEMGGAGGVSIGVDQDVASDRDRALPVSSECEDVPGGSPDAQEPGGVIAAVHPSGPGLDIPDARGRIGLDQAGRDLAGNPDVVVRNVELLAAGWHVLRRTTFDYRRSDGCWTTEQRETYDRGNGATILLYDITRRTVLLTRQFRFPVYVNGHPDGMLIETAAGLLDSDDPATAIRRETAEELGVDVGRLEHVFDVWMSPGSVTEQVHFYAASYRPADRTSDGGGLLDDGEDIEVLELGFDKALHHVTTGQIADAKTIMLLQWAALNGPFRAA